MTAIVGFECETCGAHYAESANTEDEESVLSLFEAVESRAVREGWIIGDDACCPACDDSGGRLPFPESRLPDATIENVLAGAFDDIPGWLRLADARRVVCDHHRALWGGPMRQTDSKELRKALRSIEGDGYKPSDVLRMQIGMSRDDWPLRKERTQWRYLARDAVRWLEMGTATETEALKPETGYGVKTWG